MINDNNAFGYFCLLVKAARVEPALPASRKPPLWSLRDPARVPACARSRERCWDWKRRDYRSRHERLGLCFRRFNRNSERVDPRLQYSQIDPQL